ncbi:MAG TPA: hypothetical protein VGP07_21095 [Polyangia bacterium]|jgi:hypothetical protein
MPVDPAPGKDAAVPSDARPDQRSMNEDPRDASRTDATDGSAGLPCPKASWDANLSNTDFCRNDIGIPSFLESGTCGDYHLIENSTDGDDEVFYYFDASGALVAIVDFSGGQYRCTAGLVAAVARPCIYRDSPSVTTLRCRVDGGPTDGPVP